MLGILEAIAVYVSSFVFLFVILFIPIAVGPYVLRFIEESTRFRHETLSHLLELTPTQFEVAVGQLLREVGYREVRRVGGAGDLAADLLCRDGNGRTIAVQCKRFRPSSKVGSPEVQKFIGMIFVHHQADSGMFVTTSSFTSPALALGKRHGIQMIDGPALVRIMGRVHREREQATREGEGELTVARLHAHLVGSAKTTAIVSGLVALVRMLASL